MIENVRRLPSTLSLIHLGGGLGSCAQFGIDGCEPFFWGYGRPERRWNGWAVPAFRREVIEVMVSAFNDDDDVRLWWVGEVLMVNNLDTGEPSPVRPDAVGLYSFDGWCWLEKST